MDEPLPAGFARDTPEDTVDDSESWNLANGWCKYLRDNGDGNYECTAPQKPIIWQRFPQTKEEAKEYPSCSIFDD